MQSELTSLFAKHSDAVDLLVKRNTSNPQLKILESTSTDLYSLFCSFKDIIDIRSGNFTIQKE
jgi:hypothetical protein